MASSKLKTAGPSDPVLRVSYIWRDELMSDLVLRSADSVTLGTTSSSTILIPELGLPDGFEIFRPGARGYVMTLGSSMSGEVELNNQKQQVRDFVGNSEGPQSGFTGSNIGPGDFGVIELDDNGDHRLFFQFVTTGAPLPASPVVRDTELLLPAFAFAFVLVGFFLTYALAFYEYSGPSFLWPDRKELVANYLLNRPPPVVEEEPEEEVKAGTETGEEKVKPASSNGAEAKSGGKGDKERKRADTPDKGEPDEPLPTRIQTGLLNKKSREAMDKVRNRGGFDKKLGNLMARLQGPANDGSRAGYGDGEGTGVGPGKGTGTLTKGTGKGTGGGGSAHADVRTQGKLNTGGKRAARGTPGGNGVKEVKIKMKTGKASGNLGGLTAEQIKKVVKTRARAISSCYQRELQRSPSLSGKVVIGWKIDSSGKVSRAKVRSTTLKNGRAEDCMVRQVNSMKFPSPKGGGSASVTFPFVFTKS
ncbi:MAG: AgmX/PglI C-terminal domain-containing protein [Kofleriaceae bacterium]|nr:AgmX/PglI C-terminal domain-containing protein [Kofleriaceae bacterium]